MNLVIPGYSFTICLGYPVDIELNKISLVRKEVAWHSEGWPKACGHVYIIYKYIFVL